MSWRMVALAIALGAVGTARGAVVIEYNTTGLPSSSPPATFAATTTADGVTAADLSHGPGTTAAGLGNGFSADHWGVDNGGTWAGDATLAAAQAADDYFQWGFTVDSSHTVSLSSLDLAMRRSAIASPDRFDLLASLDGFATAGTEVANWSYFGRSSGTAPGTLTPFQWMTTDTAGQGNGDPISTQDLSGAALLQNVAPGTTVTFRLYGWYDGTGSPASSNTVALGRASSTDPVTSGGPSLGGTVTAVPEPTGLCLLAGAVFGLVRRRRK